MILCTLSDGSEARLETIEDVDHFGMIVGTHRGGPLFLWVTRDLISGTRKEYTNVAYIRAVYES